MMKLTLVIPAYNEARVIGHTVSAMMEALAAHPEIDWRIVVVDNASNDCTKEAVESLRDERVHVLALREKGKGRAVRAGFADIGDGVAAFTDADLSVDPEEIIGACAAVARKEADIVTGSRVLPKSQTPDREWWRGMSSRVFILLAKLILGTRTGDTQCPLKAMNARGITVMLATQESTWFFDLEFFALAEKLGLTIKEIPVTWSEHRYPNRRSKLSMVRDGVGAIIAMLRIRRRVAAQLQSSSLSITIFGGND